MDEEVQLALQKDRLVDITTIGRKSGEPRRIEIANYPDENGNYLTGRPGRRSWHANLRANPEFVFHLKQSVQRDLPARAVPVTDKAERRAFFERLKQRWGGSAGEFDVEAWTARAPLVRIEFQDA